MKITSISQLRSVIQLCRRNGVVAIDIDGIKINMLELKEKSSIKQLALDPLASAKIPTYSPIQAQESQDEAITSDKVIVDELSEEQALYYSSRSEPQ